MPAKLVSAPLSATGRGAGWLVGARLNPVAGVDKEVASTSSVAPRETRGSNASVTEDVNRRRAERPGLGW